MDEEVKAIQATKDNQLTAVLTIMYFIVESGRRQVAKGESDTIKQAIGMRGSETLLLRLTCSSQLH